MTRYDTHRAGSSPVPPTKSYVPTSNAWCVFGPLCPQLYPQKFEVVSGNVKVTALYLLILTV